MIPQTKEALLSDKRFFMALSLNDVEKIAKLSRLTLTDEEKQNACRVERHFRHG